MPASPVASAMLKVDARQIPIAPTDDVGFQATTRGGRVMDHILGNKAVFKSATDAGSVAMLGGITTAVASRDRTTQVGLGDCAGRAGDNAGFGGDRAEGGYAGLG